jgi:hypothetical protein
MKDRLWQSLEWTQQGLLAPLQEVGERMAKSSVIRYGSAPISTDSRLVAALKCLVVEDLWKRMTWLILLHM